MDASPQIAFIDLDDTLLARNKTVSAENRAAVERLRSAGAQIVIASGRHHLNIVALGAIEKLEWVLSSNGALVRHEQTGEIVLETTMLVERVLEISELGREMGMSLIAYHRDGAFMERPSKWTDRYGREAGWLPKLAEFSNLAPEGFYKILWSESPERIREIEPQLKSSLGSRYNMVVSGPELLEFLAPGTNKAAGARVLCANLGIDSKNALAFGDGNNDVEILQWAGFSVAMRHGRKTAQQAARLISPEGPPETAFARAVDLALNH